ncbi:DUF6942 family protein [Flocculibacter collagenilyticus]|uniref:DUF6942 family protein n=1 Tax=Flocculibacter collagenilyticus TaxID=2744479 RepID=UPI0018F4EBD3|nr:hypothetical protein [Flocculibacter collagenilyticus]
MIGVGCSKPKVILHVQNHPPLDEYKQLINEGVYRPLRADEIKNIISQSGNHWRKIFSIYAKLLFAITKAQYQHHSQRSLPNTWQDYRDTVLLTEHCIGAIQWESDAHCFSCAGVHLICGFTYAAALLPDVNWQKEKNGEPVRLWQLTSEVSSIDKAEDGSAIWTVPYFDYRQFPNALIEEALNTIF